jgi:hypothetical protein
MFIVVQRLALLGALVAGFHTGAARGDFRIEQTSRVTGGSILQYTKLLGGALAAPVKAVVAVKGNKMVHLSDAAMEVIDLDARTVTTVNQVRRTFQVKTFDQFESTAAKPPGNADVKVDIVSGKETKVLLDQKTHEKILTILMSLKDPQSGRLSDAKIESDMFLANRLPGAEELRDFYRHLSGVGWVPGGLPGISREIAQTLAHVYRTSRQLDGLALMTVFRVEGAIPGIPAQTEKGALMEMTVEVTAWSGKPVDDAIFRVPAGYKKMTEEAVHWPRH